jgi:multidrug resistance efflux pump
MGENETTEEVVRETATARTVSLYTISETNGTAVRTADGNAFIVRAESGGRVERIAKVGDTVARGAVVAQVENSAQRAAVLQAQGAYEAALAAANQSTVGQDSAERAYEEALTQAVNAYKSAFSTADDVLRNTVDQVFSQPDSMTPGLKIDSRGDATKINNARVDLERRFDLWRAGVGSVSSNDALTLLETAEANVSALSTLVVTLTAYVNDDDRTESTSLRTDFATARGTLTGVLTSLSGARSALIGAESAKEQAEIAGGDSDTSLAQAQVKQALGVLESARAALNKTAIKTPVAGTVTAVSISVGDIINVGSDVVFVASDATAETGNTITVPLTAVKFTPTKAFVFTVEDGTLVAHEVKTGLVTTNSITISGAEGVTDIVLDVRGLKEGDTVTLN